MAVLAAGRAAHRPRWHVVELQALGTKSFWKTAVIGGVVTPLLYVLALGVGLGTVVDRHGTSALHGYSYLVFVGPAFLTATALQLAASDSSYPVMAGFKWNRTFHGIAATPMSPGQIVDGLLIWIALRLSVNSLLYLGIMTCFGAAHRWQVILAVPAAVLTGVAFAAPVSAYAATLRTDGVGFNILARFVVTPMFLFAGTFYPISQLPAWGRWVARVSPLWHGTELARDANIGGLSALGVLGHVGYLLLWLVAGAALAHWRFRVRLAE